MMIRKAEKKDIPAVSAIYDEIHDAEEKGVITVGWERGVYPTKATAENALICNELFVVEDNGEGFDTSILENSSRPGMGLYNINSRISSLKGSMIVDSAPGKGTRVTIVVNTLN